MYENAAKSYRQAYVFTAKPMKLVIMCYDEAIGSLKLACQCYRVRDYEAKARALQRAVEMIHEVNSSLDLEKGGEIARNLRALYLYMIKRLAEADLKKDLGMFEEVIRMLEDLLSAWKKIACADSGEEQPVPYGIPAASAKPAPANRAWSA